MILVSVKDNLRFSKILYFANLFSVKTECSHVVNCNEKNAKKKMEMVMVMRIVQEVLTVVDAISNW